MKKFGVFLAALATVFALSSARADAAEKIKLGVSFFPFHSSDSTKPDLLDAIAPVLKEKGYEIDKVVFLNYAEANPALASGEIDGNLIQHELYMNIFNERAEADLVIAQPVYHATFALYSGKYQDLDQIPNGETVFIPNDGVNTARALLLLQGAGLIELSEGATFQAQVSDIVRNDKNLNFVGTPLTTTAGAYDEAERSLAVMYPTFARSLDLTGDAERIYLEPRNEISDAYAVSFAVRAGDLEDLKTQAVIEALQSDAVAAYLAEHYSWASTPAN
ncbi:MAG: MetQ/NlpA family ABC transporter substrate-binding protein [Pseudomonadota bacterium]